MGSYGYSREGKMEKLLMDLGRYYFGTETIEPSWVRVE
jgi:hypothetical protein